MAKIANTIDDNILSIGHGMIVIIDKNDNITINYQEPISQNKIRCNIITSTKALKTINFKGNETECQMSFEQSRVKFLQDYLNKYQEIQSKIIKTSTRKK